MATVPHAPADAPAVLLHRHGHVAVVTVSRPHRRNAINRSTAEALAETFTSLDADASVRAVVLTGAGGTFSAGMDLRDFPTQGRPSVPGRGFAGFVQAPPRLPVIAAVEGWALGGGFEMVLACDLVVAAEDARFGLPEVTRGLGARGGGAFRLPRRLPYALAMELVLTGEPIDATRAAGCGLVNRLAPPGGALDAAIGLAQTVAANAPLAVAASLQVVRRSPDWPDAEAFSRQDQWFDPVFASADAAEGARAFAERRVPVWTGR
ncbi:crotonase/enoyl-CoA hydratase family protein [Micromonospora craniellae]|uniref:Enoyl-CoA hydratase n=1 Tax=Micromonospora craniellae TaxID=2294034 RepID=A0A372G2X4_9ACTN|nr:crotonase/enoyl-CoA hydratase family protein [Micromonospora craniellae]QOC92131.1 crotonase/enoyl-CoA hydratase family protein [Micromonospora craniellae]RFS47411.1 enoyl-CoA hydratase [Micromonospora craniellae]